MKVKNVLDLASKRVDRSWISGVLKSNPGELQALRITSYLWENMDSVFKVEFQPIKNYSDISNTSLSQMIHKLQSE